MRKYLNLFESNTFNQAVSLNREEPKLTTIPEKYNGATIKGFFNCSNNNLTSLVGSPSLVHGSFYCANNQLTTLEGAPKDVEGFFQCSNNQLTSLKGVSKFIGGKFICTDNPNLTPWEMRYILFTNLIGYIDSDYSDADLIINDFLNFTEEEKKEQVHNAMAELKAL